MNQQVTKKCHWVPQSYLKAFAADEQQLRIWRFSKFEGDPELKLIEKVAVKYHLYAPLSVDGTRNDSMEKKLAQLENWFGEPMWSEVCNGFPDFSRQPLRKMVSLLVAVMWLRTPIQFEFWKSMHRSFIDYFESKPTLPDAVTTNDFRVELDHSTWPTFKNASEEEMKKSWNDWLGESAEMANMLAEMRWAILFSESPVFITSDNPVLIGDTVNPYQGLKHADAMVTFPLSPTRILIMDTRHNEPDSQFYSLNHDPAATNLLIWRNAIEHMFSPRNPDDVCAEMNAHAKLIGIK